MDVFPLLRRVRDQQPLVHHLTNWVTIYDCANIVKVFGASPIMAHAREEAADMARLANALVLNIGTLTVGLVDAMKLAARPMRRAYRSSSTPAAPAPARSRSASSTAPTS